VTSDPEEKRDRQELNAANLASALGTTGNGPLDLIVFAGLLLVAGWFVARARKERRT
jgi:hypothetical protein